jgi:hypothetical protein
MRKLVRLHPHHPEPKRSGVQRHAQAGQPMMARSYWLAWVSRAINSARCVANILVDIASVAMVFISFAKMFVQSPPSC